MRWRSSEVHFFRLQQLNRNKSSYMMKYTYWCMQYVDQMFARGFRRTFSAASAMAAAVRPRLRLCCCSCCCPCCCCCCTLLMVLLGVCVCCFFFPTLLRSTKTRKKMPWWLWASSIPRCAAAVSAVVLRRRNTRTLTPWCITDWLLKVLRSRSLSPITTW